MEGFCFKRNCKLKKNYISKLHELAPTVTEPQPNYIINPGIFGIQAFS